MTATDTITRGPAGTGFRVPGGMRALGAERERRLDWLAVGVPALIALGLCLYELTTRSLWLDESATVAIASQHGAAFGSALARDGGNMLAYYALLHVLIGWFGSGPVVLRLPSVIFAVATVAATGGLALRLFGRAQALAAGLLTAVSLSLVYWGQDARGYTAMVALIAGSFLAFAVLLEPGSGWRSWLAYVVLMTAAVYAGLEAVLVIPAQLVLLAWRRDRWQAAAGAVVTVGVLCLPLAVLAASRGSGQLFWVPPPSFRILRQIVQTLTSAGLQPNFYTSTTTALAILSLVILAAGLAAMIRLVMAGGWRSLQGPALVVAWLIVPALLALIESAVGQSIFQARYLLISLPAVSLLIAWTLGHRRLPRAVLASAAVALITLRVLQLAPAYGVSSENWRGLTRYVISHAHPRDCLAFYPLDNRQAFRYYLTAPGRAPEPILPATPWPEVRPFVEDYAALAPRLLAGLGTRCARVWLVASHEGRAGGPPVSRANYRRFAGLTSGLQQLFPRQWTASFGADNVVTLTLYSR